MAPEEETSPSATLDRSFRENSGAEEGTRTPTPLRVHGPEPCASANSATSALNEAPDKNRRLRREILLYFKGFGEGVKSAEDRDIGKSGNQGTGKSSQSVNPRRALAHP